MEAAVVTVDHPSDGLLIGVACGAGFAVMETMGYSCVAPSPIPPEPRRRKAPAPVAARFNPAAHMAWTGLTAAAVWHAAREDWGDPAPSHARRLLRYSRRPAHGLGHEATPAYLAIAATSLTLLGITGHQLRRL